MAHHRHKRDTDARRFCSRPRPCAQRSPFSPPRPWSPLGVLGAAPAARDLVAATPMSASLSTLSASDSKADAVGGDRPLGVSRSSNRTRTAQDLRQEAETSRHRDGCQEGPRQNVDHRPPQPVDRVRRRRRHARRGPGFSARARRPAGRPATASRSWWTARVAGSPSATSARTSLSESEPAFRWLRAPTPARADSRPTPSSSSARCVTPSRRSRRTAGGATTASTPPAAPSTSWSATSRSAPPSPSSCARTPPSCTSTTSSGASTSGLPFGRGGLALHVQPWLDDGQPLRPRARQRLLIQHVSDSH